MLEFIPPDYFSAPSPPIFFYPQTLHSLSVCICVCIKMPVENVSNDSSTALSIKPCEDSENQWFHAELPEVPHTSFVITAQYVNEQKLQHISIRRLLASVLGVNLFGVFQWLWTSLFQSSIVLWQRSSIQVFSFSLSFIDNSFIQFSFVSPSLSYL